MDTRKEIDKVEEVLKKLDDSLMELRTTKPEADLIFNVRRSIVGIEEAFYQLRKFKNENS